MASTPQKICWYSRYRLCPLGSHNLPRRESWFRICAERGLDTPPPPVVKTLIWSLKASYPNIHSFNLATQAWRTLPECLGRAKGTGLGFAEEPGSHAWGASYLWSPVPGGKALPLEEARTVRRGILPGEAASGLSRDTVLWQENVTANKNCPGESVAEICGCTFFSFLPITGPKEFISAIPPRLYYLPVKSKIKS